MERGWREICPNCPRCGSTNTKFCYYNNYSLTQPRYFCKGCRRYWTKGGSLRNVPVGGGCRKSQRSRSSSSLRLATTNNHHNGGNSNVMFGLGGNVGATSITNNNHLGHNSYGSTNNMVVESNNSPSSNSQAPTIDLALVYANFLNKEPENNKDNAIELSQINDEFQEQGIHRQPQQQQHNPHNPHIVGCANNDISFSQGISTLPYMGNENKNHHDKPRFIEELTSTTPNHPIQYELGLPPLPGESSSSWASLSSPHDNNNNNLIADVQVPLRLPGSDPDPDPDTHTQSQFSNLFIGNWSPLDLPSFETSSSSSMP